MFTINRSPRAILVFTALLFFLAAGNCRAQGEPAGQADDTKNLDCLIRNGFHAVHLTIYQVPAEAANDEAKAEFKPYCQELPHTGKTYITLDLLDGGARNAPMTVSVQQDHDDGPPSTLSEIPRQTYPAGVVEAVADLTEPGRYRVVLDIDDKRATEDRITIPMTVRSPYSLASVLPYVLLGLAALGGLLAVVRRLRIRQPSK
ncbi:MAG: hypothetical protein ACREWG_09630 [Gammaproteobacteria bacterium]